MDNDYVKCWWQRDEFAEQRGDFQTGASWDQPGADLLQDTVSVSAMQQTPLGEPLTDFDVRCVYDSRPVNGYDFNYAQSINIAGSSASAWTATFVVPNGYRAIPRKWTVSFDGIAFNLPAGNLSGSTATIQQNGAGLPNNGPLIIGLGTEEPIETFFICEENTTFGIAGITPFYGYNGVGQPLSQVNVSVYGNLIPVTDAALPLSVSNRKYGT